MKSDLLKSLFDSNVMELLLLMAQHTSKARGPSLSASPSLRG